MEANLSNNFNITPQTLPKHGIFGEKQSDLSAVEAQQGQISDKLGKLKDLIKTLDSGDISKKTSDLDQALPLNGQTIPLEILIQNLAQSVGLTVGDISI